MTRPRTLLASQERAMGSILIAMRLHHWYHWLTSSSAGPKLRIWLLWTKKQLQCRLTSILAAHVVAYIRFMQANA